MFRRRRRLVRSAVVGGTASAAGKHTQSGEDQEADQDAPPESPEPAQPPASAPTGAIGDASIVELQKLAKLKETGVLTQDEFDEQKRRLLQDA